MKSIVNQTTILWALGVVQPATISEVELMLQQILSQSNMAPKKREIQEGLERQIVLGRVIRVSSAPIELYSLTYKGHLALPHEVRKVRDKARIFLLHKARRAKKQSSRGVVEAGLAGDAPAVDISTDIKGAAANKVLGREGFGQELYWPRLAERLNFETGPQATPRAHNIALPYLSFLAKAQVEIARGHSVSDASFDSIGIAVCMGISPRLIRQMLFDLGDHYRTFKLPKKGGGVRTIESPRVFLKTIQGFLADYVFHTLSVHDSVHSFRHHRSIATNASQHEGRRFVANIDIINYFGSVNGRLVAKTLVRNGFSLDEARILSALCTLNDHLPQGAPSSPVLSNAILYTFDFKMSERCKSHGLSYSRYADDITISGDDRRAIVSAISVAQTFLRKFFGLELNNKKTRIAGRGGQQRVTGAVVNVESAPSRLVRRKIRAMVHNAMQEGFIEADRAQEMMGYINHLNAFPKYAGSTLVNSYRSAVLALRSAKSHSRRRKSVRG